MRAVSALHRVRVALVLSLSMTLARVASAEEAAPLPAKDLRWSATLGGTADVGSLPRASTGLAMGFDVRRGALAARGVTSIFAPQREPGSGASVALVDLMSMVCALAPVRAWFDAGACGGGGLGLLRAAEVPGGPSSSSGASLRLQGLATARFDLVLSPAWSFSLETGAVVDPLRTALPVAGASDAARASLLAFRGVLGIYLRVW